MRAHIYTHIEHIHANIITNAEFQPPSSTSLSVAHTFPLHTPAYMRIVRTHTHKHSQTENNVRSRIRDPKPHTRHDTTRRWRADDDAWRRHKGASGVTAAAAAAQQQQQRRRRRKQLRCELFSDAIVPNYSHACICHIIAYADARARTVPTLYLER